MKTIVISSIIMIVLMLNLIAGDIDLKLNSANGSTKLEVLDSNNSSVLSVDSDGNVLLPPNGYLNNGNTIGSSGYGIRDYNGVMQYKNNNGTWTPFGNSNGYSGFNLYSYGQIHYDHYDYSQFPTFTIPKKSDGYGSVLPPNVPAGTPYSSTQFGDVEVINVNGKPAYFRIKPGGAGVYRISATVGVMGVNSASFEIEIFRQNGSYTGWTTGSHDLEDLSSCLYVTNNQYASGAINGICTLNDNDYLALMARTIDTNSATQKVICINFNIERIR